MKNTIHQAPETPLEMRLVDTAQFKENLQQEYAGGFDAIEEQWLLDYAMEYADESFGTEPVTVEEVTNEVFVILAETPYWAQAADRFWRVIQRSLLPI